MARRDYNFIRSYGSIGRDMSQAKRWQAAGYGGVMFDYNDPYIAQAVADAQAAGIRYGFWGDPNAVGNDPTKFAMRMAQTRAQYGGDYFSPDIETIGKGYKGSEGWNMNQRFADEWKKYMGGARTAVAPMGYQSDFNYAAWGPGTEWMPQAYYADSVSGPAGNAQAAVDELIAAAKAQGYVVDPSMVSPILAPSSTQGYAGSPYFTIDDFMSRDIPKGYGPDTPSTATGGSGVPTGRTTQSSRPSGPLSYLGRGASQSAAQIQQRGLQWGGKNYANKEEFSKYLKQKGTSYAAWAAKRPIAGPALAGRK
jgi:hypothetical protein